MIYLYYSIQQGTSLSIFHQQYSGCMFYLFPNAVQLAAPSGLFIFTGTGNKTEKDVAVELNANFRKRQGFSKSVDKTLWPSCWLVFYLALASAWALSEWYSHIWIENGWEGSAYQTLWAVFISVHRRWVTKFNTGLHSTPQSLHPCAFMHRIRKTT